MTWEGARIFRNLEFATDSVADDDSMHRWIPTHGDAHLPLEACKRAVSYVRFRTDLRETLP